jgi:hypothetical protein
MRPHGAVRVMGEVHLGNLQRDSRRLDVMFQVEHNALIGRYVHIYWEGDACWYRGTVTALRAAAARVAVAYDDGDAETAALAARRVRLEMVLGEALPPPTAAQIRCVRRGAGQYRERGVAAKVWLPRRLSVPVFPGQ